MKGKKKKNNDSSGPFQISNGRIFLQTAVVRYCRRRKDNNEQKKPFHRQLFCFWTRTICVPVYICTISFFMRMASRFRYRSSFAVCAHSDSTMKFFGSIIFYLFSTVIIGWRRILKMKPPTLLLKFVSELTIVYIALMIKGAYAYRMRFLLTHCKFLAYKYALKTRNYSLKCGRYIRARLQIPLWSNTWGGIYLYSLYANTLNICFILFSLIYYIIDVQCKTLSTRFLQHQR